VSVKTVDSGLCHWVAIAVTVGCAVVPIAVPKVLNLYNVDLSKALESGSILDAMMLISFAFAWLAAFAVASRQRFVIASVVGGSLALFLVASTGGTIGSRMFQYREPPPHIDSKQTAMRFDGERTGLISPPIILSKENGITIEGWIKPEGKSKMEDGYDPILVENIGTGFGSIKFGIKLTQSLNWVAAASRALGEAKIASAPDLFAFDESLKRAEWTHFAAVIQGDSLTLFINGQLAASEILPEDWFFPQVWVVVLGGNRMKTNRAIVGLLDEIRVSDTARYKNDFRPQREWEPDDQTVVLYHLDATPDGTIYDHSGNKYHMKDHGVEWVDLEGS